MICAGCPLAGVTAAVAKEQFAKLGRAPQLSPTALEKPPDGVTTIVNVADCPAVTVAEAGDTLIAKPGAATVTVTGAEVLARLFASPP